MVTALLLFLSVLQHGMGLRMAPSSVEPVTKVVYIKTHSTGSSTLTGILHRYCDFHRLRCFVHPENIKPGYTLGRENLKNVMSVMESKNQTVDIWPNHAILEPDLFDHMIPGNLKISIFRNPLDRVLSSFKHGHWRAGGTRFVAHTIRKTIRELKNNTLNREFLTDRFDDPCGPQGMPMSRHVPVDKFNTLDFVLLTEQYNLGLVMLQRRLGWSKRDMMYLRLKDHNEDGPVLHEAAAELKEYITGPKEHMTTAARNVVETCIEGDEAIYDLAQKKFVSQWQQLSAQEQKEVQDDVKRFEMALENLAACCREDPEDRYCKSLADDNIEWVRGHQLFSVRSPDCRKHVWS